MSRPSVAMEVHPEVYKWLGALQLVDGSKPTPAVTRSGKILLDDDTAFSFENGQVNAWRPAPRTPTPHPKTPTCRSLGEG